MRRSIALTICGLIVLLFYSGFCGYDLAAGFTSDDAVYLLLADIYSPYKTANLPVYTLIREQSLFPPLFPLLLGVLGAGSESPALAAYISTGLLLLSIVIAGIWLWRESARPATAVFITLLLCFLPGTLILSQEIWSEFLFMVLTYSALLLGTRPRLQARDWLAMAVLIALATLTRTMGVALLPAFFLLLYRHRVRAGLLYAFISTAPFLLWYVAAELLRDNAGYTSALGTALPDYSIPTLLDLLSVKLIAMYQSLLWLFASVDSGRVHYLFSSLMLLPLLALAVKVWFVRARCGKMDAVFIPVYLFIILIWPYGDVYYVSRFLFPVLPVLMLYASLGVQQLLHNRPGDSAVITVLIAALLVITAPSVVQFTQRAYAGVAAELAPYRHDRTWLLSADVNQNILRNTRFIVDTLHSLRGRIDEQECLHAFQAPLVMLYTLRISGMLPPPQTPDAEFLGQTAMCRYYLALPIADTARHYPEHYPMQRLRPSEHELTGFYLDPQTRSSTAIYLLRRIKDTIVLE